jgi:hypothetical protein
LWSDDGSTDGSLEVLRRFDLGAGGLIGVEGLMDAWPADRRKEWNDAVKEHELIEQASKGVDRPDPLPPKAHEEPVAH